MFLEEQTSSGSRAGSNLYFMVPRAPRGRRSVFQQSSRIYRTTEDVSLDVRLAHGSCLKSCTTVYGHRSFQGLGTSFEGTLII